MTRCICLQAVAGDSVGDVLVEGSHQTLPELVGKHYKMAIEKTPMVHLLLPEEL